MSAETFVFTQLQSGALPTELSEVFLRTNHHYLILINSTRDGKHSYVPKFKAFGRLNPYLIIGRGHWYHRGVWNEQSTAEIALPIDSGMYALK